MKIREEFVGIRVFSFDMNYHEWFTNCHKLFLLLYEFVSDLFMGIHVSFDMNCHEWPTNLP